MTLWSVSSRMSLRWLLTLPYVVLVVLLVALIGGLSYRSGRDTVDALASQLLVEQVSHVRGAIERRIGGAVSVLDIAFPKGVSAPESLTKDQPALMQRFWFATSVHLDANNYAYYADLDGHFFGLWRFSEDDAELRLLTEPGQHRTIYRVSGMGGALRAPVVEEKVFEPRLRPWFKAAQASVQPDAWAPIYIDFKTLELVVTRTRRISDATGRPQGVVATDFSLKQLSAYLGTLSLSPNALAVVAEHGGNLVAVSRGPHLKTVALGEHVRLNAAESGDPLVSGAFRAAQAMEAQRPVSGGQARSGSFRGEDGQVNQFGYARFTDSAGLDLLILVALPRADFLADVERNIVHTSLLAGLAALVAMGLGLALLAIVTRELRQFAAAARRVGEGVFEPLPQVARQDEIGELARSFSDMQHRLLTDQLTGLSNRHAILRRIEDRVLQQRRRGDEQPFVVMFVDFNRFKEINDRFGHAVGDLALTEMSQRLRQAVRVGDLVARYAGDEFVILLESVHNRGDAEAVRQHIEASLILPLNCLVNLMPPGEASAYGASCGLAVFPLDGQDTDSLLKHADADMYARKALSKSQRAADADKRPPPDAP